MVQAVAAEGLLVFVPVEVAQVGLAAEGLEAAMAVAGRRTAAAAERSTDLHHRLNIPETLAQVRAQRVACLAQVGDRVLSGCCTCTDHTRIRQAARLALEGRYRWWQSSWHIH